MSGDDARTASNVRNAFADSLAGHPVNEIPNLIDTMVEKAESCMSLVRATAFSALEQAMWDLHAQTLDVPLHALLGGARRTAIPLYANINRFLDDRSPGAFAEAASLAVSDGFLAIKCAPFDEVLPPPFGHGDQLLELGFDRIGAVRRAVGADIDIMVDCHGRLGATRTAEFGDRFASYDLKWLEEPVVTNEEMWRIMQVRSPGAVGAQGTDLAGLKRAVFSSPVPIAGGEFEIGLRSVIELLSEGVLRYLMPDVKYCGGISTALATGEVAAAFGVMLSPHNPSGPIATLASAHVAAASRLVDSLEIAWRELLPDRGLLDPPLDIRDGTLTITDAPGLGARLVPEVATALEVPLVITNPS